MIVLGFGCVEEQERIKIKNAIMIALLNNKKVEEVLKKWNDKADEYDKLSKEEAPERYTRIFFYDNKITYHHINRKHAFSPDGWALLKVEEDFKSPDSENKEA